MIKELKANFYRILRSKSFIVICILIFLLSVFLFFEVKAIADNPGDWIGYLEKLAGTEESTATTEDPSAATDEAVNSDVSVSVSALSENLDMLGELDNFDGVLRMNWCNELVCFLHCIFIALFISAEYKSHFHVNHFSLNASPRLIVFVEWLSLIITVLLIEVVAYGFSLGICALLCNSFDYSGAGNTLKYGALMAGIMVVYASFAFMMAYIRKAAALSIVLSSLFVFGIMDFIYGFASVWIEVAEYFALNYTIQNIAYGRYDSIRYGFEVAVIVFYTAVFLGVSLIVASTRDPY